MKCFILEKVIVYVLNPCLNKNDVIANFEYEKLDVKQVKLILNAYIGEDYDSDRFLLKMISCIQLQK